MFSNYTYGSIYYYGDHPGFLKLHVPADVSRDHAFPITQVTGISRCISHASSRMSCTTQVIYRYSVESYAR